MIKQTHIGILSDIHSNIFALREVVRELRLINIKDILILGDTFGYYPWAVETYKLLSQFNIIKAVIGNHDAMVIDYNLKSKLSYIQKIAKHNRSELLNNAPEALIWLASLPSKDSIILGNINIDIMHGSPANFLEGRIYPDFSENVSWLPRTGYGVLLGHTHYPYYNVTREGGIIFNPGSVGQPRDGNANASWGIFDCNQNEFLLFRTKYPVAKAQNALIQLNWDIRSINALNKTDKNKQEMLEDNNSI